MGVRFSCFKVLSVFGQTTLFHFPSDFTRPCIGDHTCRYVLPGILVYMQFDSWFYVIKENDFLLFLIVSHLNALQYDTLFSFYFIFMSQIMPYFLHSTSVLWLYIDLVLTLSIILSPTFIEMTYFKCLLFEIIDIYYWTIISMIESQFMWLKPLDRFVTEAFFVSLLEIKNAARKGPHWCGEVLACCNDTNNRHMM